MGCPSGVCSGYELTTDLDFDTDGDSVSGPGDDYWNEGSGWDPIGDFDNARFNTTFDGNGNTISNLYINRMTGRWIGLFGFGNWGSRISPNPPKRWSLGLKPGMMGKGRRAGQV